MHLLILHGGGTLQQANALAVGYGPDLGCLPGGGGPIELKNRMQLLGFALVGDGDSQDVFIRAAEGGIGAAQGNIIRCGGNQQVAEGTALLVVIGIQVDAGKLIAVAAPQGCQIYALSA